MNFSPAETDLDRLSISAIRAVALDVVKKAPGGSPGPALEAVPMLYVLWSGFLKHVPSHPGWFNRDRFLLSAAHGPALLYSLLYLTGYDLALPHGDAKEMYPESRFDLENGIVTGLGEAVGMAMAEAQLAARYNRPGFDIVNHYTYVIVSDGDLVGEGATRAASLAGHLKLGKLVCLYDSHHVGPSPLTGRTCAEHRVAHLQACGWHSEVLADGNDLEAIGQAICAAHRERDRPSLIVASSQGAPGQASPRQVSTHRSAWHEGWLGSGREERGSCIPDAGVSHLRGAVETGRQAEQAWQERFAAYAQVYPDLACELGQTMRGELPAQWDVDIPYFRARFQPSSMPVPSKALPHLWETGGLWHIRGHNLHFGPGEHGLRAVLSGMVAHGGTVPFSATFLIFAASLHPFM